MLVWNKSIYKVNRIEKKRIPDVWAIIWRVKSAIKQKKERYAKYRRYK